MEAATALTPALAGLHIDLVEDARKTVRAEEAGAEQRLVEARILVDDLVRLCETSERFLEPDEGPARVRERDGRTELGLWLNAVVRTIEAVGPTVPAGVADRELMLLANQAMALQRAAESADFEAVDEQAAVTLHLARAVGRKLTGATLDAPEAARDFVLQALGSSQTGELADVLGITPRTLTSWRNGASPSRNADRLVLLAQMVSVLQGSYTPRGVQLWLRAARDELEGRSPLEALKADPAGTWERLRSTLRTLRG